MSPSQTLLFHYAMAITEVEIISWAGIQQRSFLTPKSMGLGQKEVKMKVAAEP